MMTLPRRRGNQDRGMTLIEVLVAILLLSIVGAMVTGIVISMTRLSSKTTAGVTGESEINDAVARVTRDIAAADPIMFTSTAAGWGSDLSPTATDLWVQNVTNGKCVRTKYFVTGNNPKRLASTHHVFNTADCTDPRFYAEGDQVYNKTIVKDLKTTSDTGAELKVFTYYDRANNELVPPLSQAQVNNIARVKIDVGSNVQDRSAGVRLSTSVAPRSADNPLITNGSVPPSCAEANLRVVSNGSNPSTPQVTWSPTTGATGFTLNRTTVVPQAAIHTAGPSMMNTTFSDTAMRGRWAVVITYTLDVTGSGGTATCSFDYMAPPAPSLSAPQVSGTVTPDTSAGPATVASSSNSLSWSATPLATGYDIYRRPIDANVTPYNATGAGSWTYLTSTTSTSYAQAPGFDQAYEYKVLAVSNDYTPALVSADSNGVKALTHTTARVLNGTPATYGVNSISWNLDSGSTVDGYALFRRINGTSPWGAPIFTTSDVNLLTYNDTTAGLGTRYDYLVTSYNDGPRGGTHSSGTYTARNARYYGNLSNVVTVLQFPDSPTTTAYGTDLGSNPDGQNSATWNSIPTATSYRLQEFDSPSSSASATVTVGTTSAVDPGNPRGTRNYYMAVACNATGCSENEVNAGLRAARMAPAYQRPANSTPSGGTNPTLTSNDISFNYTLTADSGEATDKYCSTAGNCSYQIRKNNTLVSTTGSVPTPTFSETMGAGNNDPNWGATNTYGVAACNPGGCSDVTTTAKDHYPGPFTINGANTIAESDNHQWWENGGYNDKTRTTGDGQMASAALRWGNSTGVRTTQSYMYQVRPKRDDVFNLQYDNWVNTSNPNNNNLTPGASYDGFVTAYAPNGLTRMMAANFQVAPNTTGFFESTQACRENITDGTNGTYKGWKALFRFKQNSATNTAGSRQNTYESNFRVTEIVGKRATPSFANFSSWSDQVEFLTTNDLGTNAQWQNMTNGDFYYRSGGQGGNTNTMSPVQVMVRGTMTNDDWYIPVAPGNGASARIRGQVNTGDVGHNVDFGDWQGRAVATVDYAQSGTGMTCPGYSVWQGREDSISRWALRGTQGAVSPGVPAGATWGTFTGNLS
jgi:prepilin-type N-terminal cleavage/methylation domain-containing protein